MRNSFLPIINVLIQTLNSLLVKKCLPQNMTVSDNKVKLEQRNDLNIRLAYILKEKQQTGFVVSVEQLPYRH